MPTTWTLVLILMTNSGSIGMTPVPAPYLSAESCVKAGAQWQGEPPSRGLNFQQREYYCIFNEAPK